MWLSIATTAIMTMTLLMISFLYFANIFGAQVLQGIEKKVDLSVTFKDNVQSEYIDAVAREMESRQDVDRVTVVTSEQALEQFRSKHQDKQVIEDSLRELDDNPLPASMYILATEPRFYENINKFLQGDKFSPFIDKIYYEDSKVVIDKLMNIVSSAKNVGLVITGTFALLVVLITFNTVRLAIYSFREEIDIMRLVGASRWFIQGPFIIETILVALVAVVAANVILFPLLREIAPQLQRFFFDAQNHQFNIYEYALGHWVTVVGLQSVVVVGLALISSMVAIRRYLRD